MNKSTAAQQLGKLGGETTKKKHGRSHFSNAGKKGMASRWYSYKKVEGLGGKEDIYWVAFKEGSAESRFDTETEASQYCRMMNRQNKG